MDWDKFEDKLDFYLKHRPDLSLHEMITQARWHSGDTHLN